MATLEFDLLHFLLLLSNGGDTSSGYLKEEKCVVSLRIYKLK